MYTGVDEKSKQITEAFNALPYHGVYYGAVAKEEGGYYLNLFRGGRHFKTIDGLENIRVEYRVLKATAQAKSAAYHHAAAVERGAAMMARITASRTPIR